VQNRYNAEDLSSDDVLAVCERERLPFMPWAPIARGSSFAALESIARAHHATTKQIALAWLLKRSPMMLVIPGTGDPAHLEENLAAGEIVLTDEDVRSIG
jgi:pyridoxine 4-dehydrogenase